MLLIVNVKTMQYAFLKQNRSEEKKLFLVKIE